MPTVRYRKCLEVDTGLGWLVVCGSLFLGACCSVLYSRQASERRARSLYIEERSSHNLVETEWGEPTIVDLYNIFQNAGQGI